MIKIANPPNIEEIKKFIPIDATTVFAYGDTIYNPSGGPIDKPLLEHEKVHIKQQENPKEWWFRYLRDLNFRLSQEVEAFQRQYRVAKTITKDRNQLFTYSNLLARNLSSKLYGELITYTEALNAIRSKKTYKFKV